MSSPLALAIISLIIAMGIINIVVVISMTRAKNAILRIVEQERRKLRMARETKVIIVAPFFDDNILQGDELSGVSEILANHEVVYLVLAGKVTMDELRRHLQSKKYSVIHFMGHGDPEHIILSDGPVDINTLARSIKGSGARLVIANTCYSYKLGLLLGNILDIPTIVTTAKLPGIIGLTWSESFYSRYFQSSDIRTSLAEANEDVRAKYREYEGADTLYALFPEGGNLDGISSIKE